MQMIQSILDTDLYKLTMQQAVCQLFPRAEAGYTFINRGYTAFPDGFGRELGVILNALAELRLTDDEYDYLRGMHFLSPVYCDFLRSYRYDPKEVTIEQSDGILDVRVWGPWYRTILWEVPLMAIISELYFQMTGQEVKFDDSVEEKKASMLACADAHYADFGTRRRYSFVNHQRVVRNFVKFGKKSFVGTSNVYLAMWEGIRAIGTQAHEWFMFHAAKYGFLLANKMAMDNWVKVYRGDLGIALTDTFTTDDFFRAAFDTKFGKLYDGLRHDSGDPKVFADSVIDVYKAMGIDPTTKTIVFSDSLDPTKVALLQMHVANRIRTSYGIGTNFTNDVGVKPLNMVVKMTSCRPEGQMRMPTVKISDDPGKHTGDGDTIELCKRTLALA
jgi:nicotinate phosphoribosyltransferase